MIKCLKVYFKILRYSWKSDYEVHRFMLSSVSFSNYPPARKLLHNLISVNFLRSASSTANGRKMQHSLNDCTILRKASV